VSYRFDGASNRRFLVPGVSTRPGTFATRSALFAAEADDGMLDVFAIPSLRGVRSLAPYRHDGRTASLRDFVRNAIVNECVGPEPSTRSSHRSRISIFPAPCEAQSRAADGDGERGRAPRRGIVLPAIRSRPELERRRCHVPSSAASITVSTTSARAGSSRRRPCASR